MLASTGTIEINGEKYTWRSPKLKHLVEVENLVGPITALATVNSVSGRVYLAYACLREDHPNLTPGIMMDWPAGVFSDLWDMIAKAIPIYGGGDGAGKAGQPGPPALPAEEAGSRPDQEESPNLSSSASSEGPAGIPSEPGSSG